MSKRLMKNSLINKSEIKEELVKIECSKDAYITRSGKVFLDYGNNNMFPLKTFVNKHLWLSLRNQQPHKIRLYKAAVPPPSSFLPFR